MHSPELEFALAAGLFQAFRWGSPAFFSVIREAKDNIDSLDLDPEERELLSGDLGTWASYDGEEPVPLDLPIPLTDEDGLALTFLFDEASQSVELSQGAKHQGKEVPLNKPSKSSGPRKWKVFVKDPKTGNIKKVNFGTSATKAIVSDPKRRASFVARHKCERFSGMGPEKRLKPQYWACTAVPKLVGVTGVRYW